MLSVGVDSLDIVRMQKFVENERFLSKFFTEYEVRYCNLTVNRTMRLAGLYCAKEAFLKAVGIGIGGGIPLNEIEINHTRTGKPYLKLSDAAKKVVNIMGFKEWDINITHTHTTSTAVCVLS